MYYREYFFYLKERLPGKCYEVLEECYKSNGSEVEKIYEEMKKIPFGEKLMNGQEILVKSPKNEFSMDYEILLRERLIEHIKGTDERFVLSKFGVYLLHYMHK